MVKQLVKHGVMVDRFSLCFGTVDGDGALLLGDLALPGNVIEFDYVPLMRTAGHYYIVRMDNMGLGGVPLDIRPVWWCLSVWCYGCWCLRRCKGDVHGTHATSVSGQGWFGVVFFCYSFS